MKTKVFIFLAVILSSCAMHKKDGGLVCLYVPEVPSKIIAQTIEKDQDLNSMISFQLSAKEQDINFASVKFRMSSTDTIITRKFDDSGYLESTINPGIYKIEIHCFEAPDFVLDTFKIDKGEKFTLNLMLGELSGYETLDTTKK